MDRLYAGVCHPECDAMLLGSLVKQIKAVDLLQPRQPRPVRGGTVAWLAGAIASLSTPTWYHSSEVEAKSVEYDPWGTATPRNIKYKKKKKQRSAYDEGEVHLEDQREGHPCTLETLLRDVKGLEAGVGGLELEEILGPRPLRPL